MGDFKLIHADCLKAMKDIPDNSVDMVLTDPPYGMTKCKWDTVIPLEPMWDHLKRITKDNGAICLFGSEPFSSHLRLSNLKMFKYDWYWQKEKASNFANTNRQPGRVIEQILVFYRKTPFYDSEGEKLDKPYKHTLPISKSNISYVTSGKNLNKDGTRKYAYYTHKKKKDIIYFSRDNANNGVHPTQKPVPLLEYLIKTYTLENETVLDFTMGSGSTGVACKNLNRKFIGIEKEKKYFDIASKRIKDA